MNLIQRLFGEPRFHRFADCFAVQRPAMFQGLVGAVQDQLAKGNCVLAATHFPDRFIELQRALDQARLNYEIQTTPVRPEVMFDALNRGGPPLCITLAAMLEPTDRPSSQFDHQRHVSAMMAERHPLRHKDEALETFVRQIPCQTRLGYFLSLDDPLINRIVGPGMVQLLQQMGANQHELITSHMITRRVNKQLIRISAEAATDLDADSSAEWIRLNLPQ